MTLNTETELLWLQQGNLRVGIVPALGGSLQSFSLERQGKRYQLFRPASARALAQGQPTDMAMFPMLPYCNRIPGNRIRLGQRTWPVSANMEGDPWNCHGSAWQQPWHCTAQSPAKVVLELHQQLPPYHYHASQSFHLHPDGLEVHMAVRNLAEEAMPFGMGLHPYFLRHEAMRLQMRSSHFWLASPDSLPTVRIATPPELDYRSPRPLPDSWRDNAYEGWDGYFCLDNPAQGWRLECHAEDCFAHLMIYAPTGANFFCLEPMSHRLGVFAEEGATNAGKRVLAPEESWQASLRFTVTQTGAR